MIDQRDHGDGTLWPGQDPIGKVVLGAVREGAPRRRRRRRRPPPGARTGVGQRNVSARCASAAICRRPISSSARRCRRRSSPGAVRAALQPLAPNIPATTSARCSSSSTSRCRRAASSSCCSAAFAVFALVLASLGIYGVDLVFGQPADAGDRHPHGARRLGARRAERASSRRRSGWRRSAWPRRPPRRGRWRRALAACCSASRRAIRRRSSR